MFIFTGTNNSKRKKAFETLGIDKTANESEIKKAYRKAALRYHPDKNKNKKEATEKFKEITDAYNVLTGKENNEDNLFSDFTKNVFDDIIQSMNEINMNEMTEEAELDMEADELFHMLNDRPPFRQPYQNFNSFNNAPVMPEVFVFGPKRNKISEEPNIYRKNINKKVKKEILQYRVRISISDIWKNIEKKLQIKNKFIKLPLYYDNIKFKGKEQNIIVDIIDKNSNDDIYFKRRGEWDLETIKSVSLTDLYEDHVMEIKLPDKTIKKVQWKGEYISNIKDEKIKGFYLYNLGLPKNKNNERGNLWIKFAIILPSNLEKILQSKKSSNTEDSVSDTEETIPEWATFDEWKLDELIERNTVLLLNYI